MNTNELETSHKRLVNPGEFRTKTAAASSFAKPVKFTLDGGETEGTSASTGWQTIRDEDYPMASSQRSSYMSDQDQMEDENDLTLEHMNNQETSQPPSMEYPSMQNNNFYETKNQLHNQANKKFNPPVAVVPPNNFSLINSYCHSMPQLYPHVNTNQALLTYFNPPPPPQLQQPKQFHHVNTYASNLSFMTAPHSNSLGQYQQQNVHQNQPSDSSNKENLENGGYNPMMMSNGNIFTDFRLNPFHFHNIDTFSHFARSALNITNELIKEIVSNSKIQFWMDRNKTTGFIYQTLPKIENPKRRIPPVRCELCKFYGHLSHTCSIKELVFKLYNVVLKSGACRCHICGQLGHPAESGLCSYIACSFCKQYGHWNHMCPNIEKVSRTLCHRCQRYGHLPERCPDQWRQFDRISTFEQTPYQDPVVNKKPVYCYQCAKKGHYGHNCPDFYRKYFIRDNYQLNPVYFFAGSSPFVKTSVRLEERDKRIIQSLVEQPLDTKFNPEKVEQDPLDDLERHQAQLKNESLFSGVNSFYQYQAPPIIPPSRYDETMSVMPSETLQLKRFLRRWSAWIVDFHWMYTLKYLIETLPTNKLAHFLKSYPILDNFIVHWMWWSYLLSKDLEVFTKDVFSGIGSMPWLLNDVRNDRSPQFTQSASSTTTGRKHRNYSSTSSTSSFSGPRRSNNDYRFVPKKMKENSMETDSQPTLNIINATDSSPKTQPAKETPSSPHRTKFLLLNKKSKEFEHANAQKTLYKLEERMQKSWDNLFVEKLSFIDFKTVSDQLKEDSMNLDLRMKVFAKSSSDQMSQSYEDNTGKTESEGVVFVFQDSIHDAIMEEEEEEYEIESLSTSKENDELESTVVYLQNESIKPTVESCEASAKEPSEESKLKIEQQDENETQVHIELNEMELTEGICSSERIDTSPTSEIENQKSSPISESMSCSSVDTTSRVSSTRSSSIIELHSTIETASSNQNIFDKFFKTSCSLHASATAPLSEPPPCSPNLSATLGSHIELDQQQQQQNQENLKKLFDLFKNADKIVKNSDDESLIITTTSAATSGQSDSLFSSSVDEQELKLQEHQQLPELNVIIPTQNTCKTNESTDLIKLLLKIDTSRDQEKLSSVENTNSSESKCPIIDKLLSRSFKEEQLNSKSDSVEGNETSLDGKQRFLDIPLSINTDNHHSLHLPQPPSSVSAVLNQVIGQIQCQVLTSSSSSSSSLSLYSVSPQGLSTSALSCSNKTNHSLSPANTSNSSTAKPNIDSSLSTSLSTNGSLSPTSYSLNKSKLLSSSSTASSTSSLLSSSVSSSVSSSSKLSSAGSKKSSPKVSREADQFGEEDYEKANEADNSSSFSKDAAKDAPTNAASSKSASKKQSRESSRSISKSKTDGHFSKHGSYHKSASRSSNENFGGKQAGHYSKKTSRLKFSNYPNAHMSRHFNSQAKHPNSHHGHYASYSSANGNTSNFDMQNRNAGPGPRFPHSNKPPGSNHPNNFPHNFNSANNFNSFYKNHNNNSGSFSRQNSMVSSSHSSSSISGGMHLTTYSEPNFYNKKPGGNTQSFSNSHHGASLPANLSYNSQHSGASYSSLRHNFNKHQNVQSSNRASTNYPNSNANYNRRYQSNANLNFDNVPREGESPGKSTSPSTGSLHFLNNRKRRY